MSLKSCPKCKKIAQSGHTAHNLISLQNQEDVIKSQKSLRKLNNMAPLSIFLSSHMILLFIFILFIYCSLAISPSLLTLSLSLSLSLPPASLSPSGYGQTQNKIIHSTSKRKI